MESEFCLFYEVNVKIENTWFVVGVFRNEDHLAFERTSDNDRSVLEFYIPSACEKEFLHIINALQLQGDVLSYKKRL